MSDEEEYRGPATLRIGEETTTIEVRLSARFEPVEGRMRWVGRTAPDPALLARVKSGVREAKIAIKTEKTVKLGDPDPWGGVRITGTGRPPW